MKQTTTTATAARRSNELPGSPRVNPNGLPYGAGSVQRRGRVWWMIFRDVEGRIIQENAQTEDYSEARRLLATRALATAQARVAAILSIIHEETGAGVTRDNSRSGTRARGSAGERRSGKVSTQRGRAAKKGVRK
jgi:hypothetical protein